MLIKWGHVKSNDCSIKETELFLFKIIEKFYKYNYIKTGSNSCTFLYTFKVLSSTETHHKSTTCLLY